MTQPKKTLGDVESLSVAELEEQIRHHNKLYWEEQSPEISDYDYDRMVVRLKQLLPNSLVLVELGESSERLGDPVQHQRPMLSLDKCYGEQDLNDWASKIQGDFVVMPKLDGIACSIRYDDQGRLALAATRGTGTVGDDVTVNARSIKEIPKKVSLPNVEVRGEIYMRLSVFDGFKAQFSNPRNLTAGAMKQKDAKKSAAYNLSFAAYDVLGADLPTEKQKFEWLHKQGFAPFKVAFAKSGELQKAYEEFAAERPTLDFEIDGVVFRANEVSEQARLGITAHHPRFALAYKFQGESGRTKLEAIEWSVSRTGAITPVALVQPVQLSGAMVSRVSLHHAGFVAKLGLTKNCVVLVTRRGGVIPNLEKVLEPGDEPLHPPESCPSCGQPTRWEDDFLFCSRPGQCRVAQIGELEHYCSVTEMLGFGERVLAEAYDKGLLKTPADLYRASAEQLEQLERVGTKLAEKLVAQAASKRELPLAVFLRALGVAELGSHVSTLLARRYGNLDAVRALTVEELAAVHSVGDIIARSVVHGLVERAPLMDDLLKYVTVTAQLQTSHDGPFIGKSFVFTGRLDVMDRKVAQEQVRKLGAETPASVSATLSYLVIGVEKDGEKSSKQKAAEKHIAKGASLQVLDEAAFLKLLDAAKHGDVHAALPVAG
jgi:DNA ligase (NAD+)